MNLTSSSIVSVDGRATTLVPELSLSFSVRFNSFDIQWKMQKMRERESAHLFIVTSGYTVDIYSSKFLFFSFLLTFALPNAKISSHQLANGYFVL